VAYWAHQHVQEIRETIERVVGGIHETSYIGNLLDQTMYCGLSLSRVGVDLRGLVQPVFDKRIIALFRKEMEDGHAAFKNALAQTKWYFPKEEIKRLGIPEKGSVGSIIQFPPLATLCNTIISGCNSLRHCAPLTTRFHIHSIVKERLIVSLEHVSDAAQTPILYSDKQTQEQNLHVLVKLLDAFDEDLIPFASSMIAKVYCVDAKESVSFPEVFKVSQKFREAQMERIRKAEEMEALEKKQREQQEALAAELASRRAYTKDRIKEMEDKLASGTVVALEEKDVNNAFRRLAAKAADGGGGGGEPSVDREMLRDALTRCLPTLPEALVAAIETLQRDDNRDTWPDDALLEVQAVEAALTSSPVLTANKEALASALAKAAAAHADAEKKAAAADAADTKNDADADKDVGESDADENKADAENDAENDAEGKKTADTEDEEKPPAAADAAAPPRVRAADVLPGGACGDELLAGGALTSDTPRAFVSELLARYDASGTGGGGTARGGGKGGGSAGGGGERGRFAKRDVWDIVRVVYYRLDGQMHCERLVDGS